MPVCARVCRFSPDYIVSSHYLDPSPRWSRENPCLRHVSTVLNIFYCGHCRHAACYCHGRVTTQQRENPQRLDPANPAGTGIIDHPPPFMCMVLAERCHNRDSRQVFSYFESLFVGLGIQPRCCKSYPMRPRRVESGLSAPRSWVRASGCAAHERPH